jgi:uncharacterized RDD family membrane protein YckC
MSDNFEVGKSAPNPYSAPQGAMTDMSVDEGTLASLWARLGAAIIDTIILAVVIFVPILLLLGGWSAYLGKIATGGYLMNIGSALLGFITYAVVNGAFLASNGQTIGKKLVGIKIVRTDGSQPTLAHILLMRQGPISVLQLIPFVGRFMGLIDVLMIFRESRQCVHDNIADTRVINA